MTDAAAAASLVDGLLAFLAERGFDSDKLNAFTAHCERMRREMDGEALAALADRLRAEAPSGDTIRLHSALFFLTGDLWHYERILHYLQLGMERAEPALLHYALWCVQRQMFMGTAAADKAASFGPCDLHRYYEALVRSIQRRWDIRPARMAARPGPVRRIAMLTNQFIGHNHQPSRDVFDFGWRLKDAHGVEAAVFNANLMPLQVECVFIPPFIAELEERFTGRQEVSLFGGRLPMESFPERPFTQGKLARIAAAVERFDPDAIVTFGGSNIVADLFAAAGARPVVTIPSTNGFTISLADRILGYDGTDWSERLPPLYRRPFRGRVRPFALGFSLLYLSLIVLIPLSAAFLKTATLSWPAFWEAVTAPRVLASYRPGGGRGRPGAGRRDPGRLPRRGGGLRGRRGGAAGAARGGAQRGAHDRARPCGRHPPVLPPGRRVPQPAAPGRRRQRRLCAGRRDAGGDAGVRRRGGRGGAGVPGRR